MKTKDDPDRSLYKWIVIGMSICLPVGIAFGIVCNQIVIGILAGNSAGIVLGVALNRVFPY